MALKHTSGLRMARIGRARLLPCRSGTFILVIPSGVGTFAKRMFVGSRGTCFSIADCLPSHPIAGSRLSRGGHGKTPGFWTARIDSRANQFAPLEMKLNTDNLGTTEVVPFRRGVVADA